MRTTVTVVIYLLLIVIALCSAKRCVRKKRSLGGKLYSTFIPFATVGRTINKNNDQMGYSLFPDDEITNNLISIKTQSTATKYQVIATDDDAKKMLNVNGKMSLQLQLGNGNIGAQGAGNYLQNSGDRTQYAEMMYVATVTNSYTVLDKVETMVTEEMCRKLFESNKTHVITGLEYGGQCIISVQMKVTNNEKKNEVEGSIEAELDVAKVKVQGKGKGKKSVTAADSYKNVTISTYCNANLMTVATNLEEAVNVVHDSLRQLKDQNPEGVPIRMEITPVEFFPQCNKIRRYRNARFMDIFLESSAAMLNDAKSALDRLENCIELYELLTNTSTVKTLVMQALSDLREVQYKMRLYISKLDLSGSIEQFKEFESIYTARRDAAPWNYRYWTEHAILLCNNMRNTSRPPREVVNCKTTSDVAMRICSEAEVTPLKVHSSVTTLSEQQMKRKDTCFVGEGRQRFFIAFALSKDVSVQTITFRTIVDKKHSPEDLDISLSSDVEAFDDTLDITRFTIIRSGLKLGTGLFQEVKIDIPPEDQWKNAVVLIERSGNFDKKVSVCNLEIKGMKCGWQTG